jgi:acetyl-CoA acetyltransferase family protein
VVSAYRGARERHLVGPQQLSRVSQLLQALVLEAVRRGYVVKEPQPSSQVGRRSPKEHDLRIVVSEATRGFQRSGRRKTVSDVGFPGVGVREGQMREAVLVDGVRTPIGKRNGALREWHPASLSGFVLKGLVERNELDPSLVDDVIMGCVLQVGEQAVNVGRNAVLSAGWPASVPATTVDRQCGSSQQAVHFAAQGVMAGVYDAVIAAGVETMTRVPMGSSRVAGMGSPASPEQVLRYGLKDQALPSQGVAAELLAIDHGMTRGELDAVAVESHRRAAQASSAGHFAREIVPILGAVGGVAAVLGLDEGIRPDSSLQSLAALKPAFAEDGLVTAGNASQISDGASACLIMRREAAAELGRAARARFVSFAVAATDPIRMFDAVVPATRQALKRAGMTIADIDLFEVNEAFASVVLAWQRELSAPMSKVNVSGGAIALGHPLGSSGSRLLTTLLHGLERTGGTLGMQVMCEGGGMANATIIERI